MAELSSELHDLEDEHDHNHNPPPPPPDEDHHKSSPTDHDGHHDPHSTDSVTQFDGFYHDDQINMNFADSFFENHNNSRREEQNIFEDVAATQVMSKLGAELGLNSNREYTIARSAAMKMAELYKSQFRPTPTTVHPQSSVPFPQFLPPHPQHHQQQSPYLTLGEPSLPRLNLNKRKLQLSTDSISSSKRSRNSSRWTDEQDEALRNAVAQFEGRNWKAIAGLVPGRDHVQCLQRWKKVLRPGLRKGHWSSEEDALLLQLIQDEKMHSWAMVAARIKGRTAKQCRERWSLNLDPGINRSPWTPEEDQLLVTLHSRLGGKWSEIKSEFNGRTENAVKTRYKSLVRAKAREWTPEQDRQLIQLRMKHGKNWAAIKKEMPQRSRNAIKVRCKTLEYDNHTQS